ncbi:hypothetical protein NL676_008043 [Syzygium grande]|nr:hypothetical protein NL676_008043 [Syzygium grande]
MLRLGRTTTLHRRRPNVLPVTLTKLGIVDEDGNRGEINPVGDTGDQIVSGPTEEILGIMDKDKVGRQINPKGYRRPDSFGVDRGGD